MIVNLLTDEEQEIGNSLTSAPTVEQAGALGVATDEISSGWKATSNCKISRSTVVYRTPPASLRVIPVNPVGATMQVDLIRNVAVTAGQTYRCYAFAKNDTPGTTVGITPRLFTSAGTEIVTDFRSATTTVFGRWSLVVSRFTAPTNAVSVNLRLDAAPTSDGVYFDQIGLVEWADRPNNKFLDLVFDYIPRYMRDQDDTLVDPDHPLARYMDLVAITANRVLTSTLAFDYISPVDGEVGYDRSTLVEPDYYPAADIAEAEWLPWLAQLVGVESLQINSSGTLTPWYWFDQQYGTWNTFQNIDTKINPAFPITSISRNGTTGVVTAVLGTQSAGITTAPTVGNPVEVIGVSGFDGAFSLTSVSGSGPYTVTWVHIGATASSASGTVTLSDVQWFEVESDNPVAFDSLDALKRLTKSAATGYRAGSLPSMQAAARVALTGLDEEAVAQRSGGIITVTCSTAHNLNVGDYVTIYGSPVSTLNLDWIVNTVTSPTTFTISSPGPDTATSSCRATNKRVEVFQDSRWNWTVDTLPSQTFATDLLQKVVDRSKPAGVIATLGNSASTAADTVMSEAVLLLDPRFSTFGETSMANLGWGGSALNATYGTSAATAAQLVVHSGTNFLDLPGVSGNYASTPDTATAPTLDIVGDIEIVVRVALDSWTSTGNQTLVSKLTPGQQSYWFYVTSTGALGFTWTTNGSTNISQTSSAPTPAFIAGTTYWLKITMDVDNGSGGRTITFFRADDQPTEPTSWTTISSDSPAGTTSIWSGSAALEIGTQAAGSSGLASGKFFHTIVRNGINGTVAFNMNFATAITTGDETSLTDSTNKIVTINRSATGLKSTAITRSVVVVGGNRFLQVPHSDLIDFSNNTDLSMFVAIRQFGTPQTSGRYMHKGTTTGPRWGISSNATSLQGLMFANDGTNPGNPLGSTFTAGAVTLLGGVINRTAQTHTPHTNRTAGTAVSTSTIGSLSSTSPLRFGLDGSGLSPQSCEILGIAVFRRRLTAIEVGKVADYFGIA